jgi:hypothetical protein
MCKAKGEPVDHLFLHCEVARALWGFVPCLLGVSWVMPRSMTNLLACWKGPFRKKVKYETLVLLLCV